MKNMVVRVVFMGSPDFALPSLRKLAALYNLVGVVSQPDRPAGRGRLPTPPPVKELAASMRLPVIQPESLRRTEDLRVLSSWEPDLIVVTAFGQILPGELLGLPRHGCINVHASLLPRWRGAAPIQAAILAGDAESGVTIMKMDAGLDTGPILSQRATAVAGDEDAAMLSARLSELGAELLAETLPGYLAGEVIPQPQPTHGITLAPSLEKEQGHLDPMLPADALVRRVRAFRPWPGTWIDTPGVRLKVIRAHAIQMDARPGARLVHAGYPALGTAFGLLVLDQVQPPGKRPMSGSAFLAGARDWLGATGD